ncbi:unnamed protein product [Prorocentrum cordatum]|uniref:DNA (cytosine-5-)-methyltransferase n=1 Tax=Prorocentrum cordatum TaxID=2364126 RepID=A0ABN9XPQ2_9DINO|nr:unnamed protein product [Polarella glacialis]
MAEPGAWPLPRGAWLDASLNGTITTTVSAPPGTLILAQVVDAGGRPQGTELLQVEVAYAPGPLGRFFKAAHVGASDEYFSWYAQHPNVEGGRPGNTVFHLCACGASGCAAPTPRGTVVEHLDIWRVVDPADFEQEKAKLYCPRRRASDLGVPLRPPPLAPPPEAAPPGEGPPAGEPEEPLDDAEPPAKRPRREPGGVGGTATPRLGGSLADGGGSPLDAELAGLEDVAADPGLEDRLARLGSRGGPRGKQQRDPLNASRPGGPVRDRLSAAELLQRGSQRPQARAEEEGDEAGDSDLERGALGESFQGVGIKRDLFRQIARRRPGALLENGLAHIRGQFTRQLRVADGDPLAPCVTQFLDTVFFVVRSLRSLGLALDGILKGDVVETGDLLMQEFKARTMAIRDGHWRTARWLTLVPQEQLPSGATIDEETAAEKVEARELKVAELRRKLQDRRPCGYWQAESQRAEPQPRLKLRAGAALQQPQQRRAASGRREGETRAQWKSRMLVARRGRAAPGARSATAPKAKSKPVAKGQLVRRWRQLLASSCTGAATKFELALIMHEAAHGAPGDVGRFIRRMRVPPDPTESFTRLREVLPLPVPDAPVFSQLRAARYAGQQLAADKVDQATAEAWVQLVVFSLNYQYTGHMQAPTVPPVQSSASQVNALGIIRQACDYFARGADTTVDLPAWEELISSKDVTYGGEEVARALPLTLGGVMPGLPAKGVAASVRAIDIADARVGSWLADPGLALLPRAEWPEEVPRASIQVKSKQEWHDIGAKLVELGLAAPIAEERIFKVGNRKVLAGAFGVQKSGTPTPGCPCVQRLIINMVPANSYQRIMRDDVGTLSASPSWVAIPLPEGHMLLWSSDDQASAFYCYELPEAWQPYMTLADAIPNERIGVSGPGKTHIALRVIPMGWVNAVTVFQHCHRRLGFSMRPLGAGFAPSMEWRKDRPLPFKSKELEQKWVQYYIDDWDHGEIVPERLIAELRGTVGAVQEEQRQAYRRSGIQVADGKAKHRALILERMGAGLDGLEGRVGVTVEKLHALLGFTLWGMGQSAMSSQAVLMILGRCVRAAEFRRPFMGYLNAVWAAGRWQQPQAVPLDMCDELLSFMMALPLAFTDLRAQIDPCVIATDASERAGGICHTVGLTEAGIACAMEGASVVSLRPGAISYPVEGVRWRPRVVIVELFCGAAAAAVAASRLPFTIVAHLSSEVDPAARRLVRRRWAGVVELGDIERIDGERFRHMLENYKRDADWVLITAGSPCQDLAGLNAVGSGLEGARSRLFLRVPELIGVAEEVFPRRVVWFVENVFSMTLESRAQFTKILKVTPVLLDAKHFTRVSRPRLYWCSWAVCSHLPPGCLAEVKGTGDEAYTRIDVTIERLPFKAVLHEGWSLLDGNTDLPCFTRPIIRKHPPLRPVGIERATEQARSRWASDGYRYQVNNYEDGVLIWDAARERSRLPDPEERGALMGFDRLYFQGAVKDSVPESERAVVMESLIGNTFCVQVVAFILGTWLAQIKSVKAPVAGQQCLEIGACEANWNVVPDFQQPGLRDSVLERSLIVEFLRIADRGGSDVRLDCGALYRARAWPRAGLRTHLWAWRIAKGFLWQRPAHISALELESAVAGARWRCRAVANHRCRYLHILDAQAIAAVSTKGRSSALALQPALRRLNALHLATGGYPIYGYCDTDVMPADTPSRWPLREVMISPLSLQRYTDAVNEVVDFWVEEGRSPCTPAQVDTDLAAFIEKRWSEHGSLFDINNAIAGVSHFFPPVRGHLRESWRLARTWQRQEPAGRALPIGPLIAAAFAGAFAATGHLGAAAVLAAGYDTYMRTGEMASLVWNDVQLYPARASAVLLLRGTKSQHQTGAKEFVLVRSTVAYKLLARAKAAAAPEEACFGMEPSAFHRLFSQVKELLGFGNAKLTLYSWRRGGASADFKSHGSMEQTLLRGRWASVRTARLYVQDAVAEATQLNLSELQLARCRHLAARLRAAAS